MKKTFSIIFIIVLLLAILGCSSNIDKSDYKIAVAAYAQDELSRQFALGVIDEAEQLGYHNVEFIENTDDEISRWAGHNSPENAYICILSRDPSVLGICEDLKAKGFNMTVAFGDMLLYHEDFPAVLKDDDVSPAIDCLLPYDEAALYGDIAAELKEKLDGRSGRLVILPGRTSGALYDANYYERCIKMALERENCDTSRVQITSLVITNTDDGLIWTPVQDESANAPTDLKEIQSDTIATLSLSTDAAKFAAQHFPERYKAAFIGLSETSAQLYESGAIDSLYCYPMYELGAKAVSHIDSLIEKKHETKVEYVHADKFDVQSGGKTLLERCNDDSLFTKYNYFTD